MKIAIPSGARRAKRTKQQWLLVGTAWAFGTFGYCSVSFFRKFSGWRPYAGLGCGIGGGMFFLLLGLSGIWESRAENGFTMFTASVRHIAYEEERDPVWFALAILCDFILAACFLAYAGMEMWVLFRQ